MDADEEPTGTYSRRALQVFSRCMRSASCNEFELVGFFIEGAASQEIVYYGFFIITSLSLWSFFW